MEPEILYILAGPAIPVLTTFAINMAIAVALYYVSTLFNKNSTPDNLSMPEISNYPVQTAANGTPIAKVYGTDRLAGNIIWCGEPVAYQIRHEVGEQPSGKGGDTEPIYSYETRYRRSFMIAICEGPAVILRAWKGKTEIELTDFTWFEGDSNTGITALTGEDYGQWPNLCCAFFEDYDLGNTQAIPNFTFEIASGVGLEGKILIYDLAGLQAMNDDPTADYMLMADIDATETQTWNGGDGFIPIGRNSPYFTGSFDGRNHTIDNLYINSTPNSGLFGRVSGASISNIKVTNITIVNGNVAGFVVGEAEVASSFTDCYGTGTIGPFGHHNGGFVGRSHNSCTYTRCAAVGSIETWSSGNNIGGFVGLLDGNTNTFTDCYARVSIARTGGDSTMGSYHGCFIGRGDEGNSTFVNCYTAASIQYMDSYYSYSYDTRPAEYTGGGFLGGNESGHSFTSCYFDQTAAQATYPDAAKYDSAYNNERQSHDISTDPTGGHFHISHDGNTTGEIAWNANEAAVQAACDATFGSGEFDIEFDSSDKWDSNSLLKVMFKGDTYGASPQADLTFDLSAMTPGGMTVSSWDDVTGVAPLSDSEITALTTAQAQTQSTYENDGWDFDTVWFMGDSGYPELRMQRLSGWDMNPANIIQDIIQNTRYGVGDTSIIDDTSLDACRSYWQTENMLLSLTLDETKPWIDWVDYILSHVCGARYFSGGKLKFGVLKNESAVATITEDDLVREDTENPAPPVEVTKRPRSDTFNRLEIGWVDRDNKYDMDYVIVQDRVDQRLNGVRKKTIKLSGIRNRALALTIGYRMLIDAMYRFGIYKFKVSFANSLLENFDVIELSDGELLSSERLRIMTIEEEVNGRGLVITAMDDLAVHYPDMSDYDSQSNQYTADPTITLDDVTVNFREDIASNKLYLSCTPANAYFNGGYVYRSYDDISYDLIGRFGVGGVTGGESNSVGTIDGFIPAHPAISWAPNESILVNIGMVTDLRTDVTDAEFWNNRYLAKIEDEIIAFKTAEETATAGIWRISNLRRGLFGTEPAAHYSGESFCTLIKDATYTYDPADIGKTVYFKVVSYYGTQAQSLADVSAFSTTVQGYYQRPAAASLLRLTADQNDGGSGEYSGASFTLYWNLGSRVSGFNYGDWLNLPWDNYTSDDDLQAIVLRFEQTDGTLISERSIAVANSETIVKATDLGGYDNAVIKVIPRRALRSRLENSILVENI